mgnify:CR=1 FL=1
MALVRAVVGVGLSRTGARRARAVADSSDLGAVTATKADHTDHAGTGRHQNQRQPGEIAALLDRGFADAAFPAERRATVLDEFEAAERAYRIELALVENLQRKDLTAFEEAEALQAVVGGVLVRIRERRVVEDALDEVVERPLERDHRGGDVDELARPLADDARTAEVALLIDDEHQGHGLGSRLLGQPFSEARYFWSRPSATSPMPYNAANSSGANQGPLNPALEAAVKARVEALQVQLGHGPHIGQGRRIARAARPNEAKPELKLDLEINPAHPIITRLEAMRQADAAILQQIVPWEIFNGVLFVLGSGLIYPAAAYAYRALVPDTAKPKD